jgi:hypothetical protein
MTNIATMNVDRIEDSLAMIVMTTNMTGNSAARDVYTIVVYYSTFATRLYSSLYCDHKPSSWWMKTEESNKQQTLSILWLDRRVGWCVVW